MSNEQVTVTQADRDAAAIFAMDTRQGQEMIRRGEADDNAVVQAFAAHRIAAEQAVLAKLRDLPDYAHLAAKQASPTPLPSVTIRAIATALADALEQKP